MPTANLAITKLGEATGLALPTATIAGLAQQGVHTLADIRRQRGLPAGVGLTPELRAKLEAHAYLSLVADDPQAGQKLIEGNIGNITAIAGMSRANFVQKAQIVGVSAEQAATIHAKAAATQAILHNVLTSARTELANDLRAPDKYSLDEFFARQGGYDERVSAVSPAAYLADLLDYVIEHAKVHGMKLTAGFGSTLPGNTDWKQWPNDTGVIYVDIDTHTANFATTPIYLTTLGGNAFQWEAIGVTSIYDATPQGFRIYLRFWDNHEISPAYANQNGWHIQWMGVEPSIKAGRTTAGTTDWKEYHTTDGSVGLYLDVDTHAAGFTTTPVYLTSLAGNPDAVHRDTTGASSIYAATPSGFRVYVRMNRGNMLTPEEANQQGWHIQWLGIEPGGGVGFTPSGATEWKQFRNERNELIGIYIDIDTDAEGSTVAPIYLTSLVGDTWHSETTGATSLYQLTQQGFRIYLRFWDYREITPEIANQNGWRLQWLRLPAEDATYPATHQFLERAFHQPFSQLLISPEEVERKVRQVRLNSEVLRNYLGNRTQFLAYLQEAYKILLNRSGTSFDEIRLAKTMTPERRQALAERLGIHLSTQRPDELDDLYLDLKQITEADLERLFGLVDTTHDFRAERGHITGDPTRQIKAAVITGIVPGVSADERGTVYVTLTTEIPTSGKKKVTVKLFRTAARKDPQDLVVWGEYVADNILFPIEITLANTTNINYGVTGAFIIGHAETMPNVNIAIESGSALVAWRRANLRRQWQAQDWPEDVYSQHTFPMLDPDLLSSNDIRLPRENVPSPLSSLYVSRKNWILQQIKELKELKNTSPKPNLSAVFQRMYKSVAYSFSIGEGHDSCIPWRLPESQFDGLHKALTGGTTAEAMIAQQRIQDELKLTVASFTRLLEIRDKYLRWKNDPANPEAVAVTDAEWEELFSILVQAQKTCFHRAWCEEERLLVKELAKLSQNQTEVLLSPKYFWLALHEPELPRWRASTEGRLAWQQALRSRGQPPLIDPDLIDENDLTQPASEKPLALLTDRRQYLAKSKQNVQNLRKTKSFGESWRPRESPDSQIEPYGVARDAVGNIYVADPTRHRVLKFDINGCVMQQWGGTAGAAQGQFNNPQGIAVDVMGNLYVADTGNHQIQKFSADGDFVAKWGAATNHPNDPFNAPTGIAVDTSGNLYVVDTDNHRIQKLDGNGGFLQQWGRQRGSDDGQFNAPCGVAIDGENNLYVADTGNHRVQKFKADGTFLTKLGGTVGNGNGQFDSPSGIAIRKDGYVYVADTNNNRIQVLNANLEFGWATSGTPSLRGIIFDAKGNEILSVASSLHVIFYDSTAGLRRMLATVWGSSFRELMTLVAERKQGHNISARLDQLGLSEAAFAHLVRAHDLLIAGEALQDAEWEEVDHIAVQSLKQREFAAWRKEESDAGITLSPDFFQIAETETIVLNRWRASAEARRAWQDKLSGRIDQDAALIISLAEAVDACEETTLPLLRDALVAASRETAKALSDRLLIDFQVGPSLKTTRVSQAITTLQSLVFALRSGQPALWLTLADPDFEERWKWLGSYETWKAAVGVFLYPENILLPGLRPKSHQTPAFRQLAGQLSQSQYRLDAGAALNLAGKYMDYVNDIFRLDTKAAVYDSQGKRVYLFAIATLASKSVYFSSYDPHDFQGFAQTCWIPLSAFADKDSKPENASAVVEDILGAVPWYDEESFIYLFLKIRQGVHGKFAFVKYNLKTGTWDSELSPLELPQENARFSIAAGLSRQVKNPEPLIAISIDHKLYIRRVRRNSWEDGDWSKFEMDFEDENADPPKLFTWLLAMIPSGAFTFDIIAQGGSGKISRKTFQEGVANSSLWTEILPASATWVGSLFWQLGGQYFNDVFWNEGDKTYYKFPCEPPGQKHEFSSNWRLTKVIGLGNYNSASQYVPTVIVGQPRADTRIPLTTYRTEIELLMNAVIPYPSSLERCLPIIPFGPRLQGEITLALTPDLLRRYSQDLGNLFRTYTEFSYPEAIQIYLHETCFFVPLVIALQLQKAQEYIAALDWFRAVYDYTILQKIYYGLVAEENPEESNATGYARQPDWLLDPLDIHAIAATRQNAYTRFTLLGIIRCLLDYADTEFTRDTVESLPRARVLYETALALLHLPELKQDTDIIGYLETTLGISRSQPGWRQILTDISRITPWATLQETVDNVRQIIRNTRDETIRLAGVRKVIDAALNGQRLLTMGALFEQQRLARHELHKRLLGGAEVEGAVQQALLRSSYIDDTEPGIMLQANEVSAVRGGGASYSFPIPPNPLIKALRLHAENNLRKLRRGRNIAGVKRELELYAAPTDVLSALPTIGAGGQLSLPIRTAPSPLPYRYEFLIERAKQLVSLAAQVEAGVLAALEKRDAEMYNLLKARQDARLARAGVRLQSLRVNQAKDEVRLAELQGESATLQRDTYAEWQAAGLNQYEQTMLDSYQTGADAQILAAYFSAGAQMFQAAASATAWGAPAAAMVSIMAMGGYMANSVAIMAETSAKVAAVWADFERRRREWEFQQALAQIAIQIADQQKQIAEDGVEIVEQEKNVAQMQVDHAEQVVEYLNNKFTNVELYDWMSGVLEGVYSYFLQQATAMAKLAQSQLAFERQEAPAAFIQDDYWVAPSEGQMGGASATATDRHGLTGSARLLADLYKLDQYRVETEKRKLQLTKVISLAHLAPFEFQQFKETGVLTFGTPMELFDRDFPGHYLRLIKRVRTSVVALIPPAHGIKATLSTTGASWVVVKNDELFQRIARPRLPESVALSSPVNATGLFELESQPEMLLPFEGLGVDTLWEFRMPKAANQFDYSTIADILLTIEYTALDDWDYRQQVIQSLPATSSGERPFSFRHQFADAWYDLNNPAHGAKTVTVRFRTERADFPPNLEALQIAQVLLYFARKTGVTDEIPVTLTFKPVDSSVGLGGAATSIDGVISTRRGNAGSWALLTNSTPVGEWELTLQDAAVNFCKEEKIEDILFVITFAGRTPAWPA